MMPSQIVVECSYCESKVTAKVKGTHESYDPESDPTPFRAVLLSCPSCNNALLAGQDTWGDNSKGEPIWTDTVRLWPNPNRFLSSSIPPIVRISIEEADKCYKAKAYTACAVMCGRSLEGVCRHYKTKSKYLGGGLKELRAMKVIDGRLFEWSETLQKHRNIGAHATTEKISKDDARDLLDFVIAISEYVFVLDSRYRRFKERKESGKK